MKAERLTDALNGISSDYILDAEIFTKSKDLEDISDAADRSAVSRRLKNMTFFRYTAVAACLCLIAVIATGALWISRKSSPSVQQWTSSMTAKEYFSNSRKKGQRSDLSAASIIMPPFAILLPLDGSLENTGVIPVIADHPERDFAVMYNGDGSLYKISFRWGRRGEGIEEYSDLIFRAAPKEIHEISDTVTVRTDPAGNELPPYVTATERNGITIFAEGAENENKTLTWQTDEGWFRVQGSFMDSYEDVVAFFDWFWEHPINLSDYAVIPADSMIRSTRADHPDAFSGLIPDLASLGYTTVSENVNLATVDGRMQPVWFEGIYSRGETRIRWTINTGADADAWAENIGRPSEITEEKLTRALSAGDHVNIFFDMPCMATLTVESGSAADAMEIVRSMQ
ncbi:MAG: hypothetical protein K6E62_13895 [Lachnospiraceae bacterium]|nr:hypothetical protein [Lachnospiraceae bacterium]